MTDTIHLKYVKGIIPEGALESLQSQLGEHGIGFECHDISGEPQASVEELLAPVILYLSSDVVQVPASATLNDGRGTSEIGTQCP